MGLFSFLFKRHSKKIEHYLKRESVLLDVRTKDEFDAGTLQNAIHIPLQDLHLRFQEVKHLNKPVIVYCKGGVRAAKAVKFLNLQNIDAINGGGMLNLKRHL